MVFPVKVFSILLAVALTAHGASSDPGKVALDFLEKVRLGKLDLAPGTDTALSPQTADGKKREIAKRLERIARDLGSDPLEVGSVKTDENFAAVLIRKVGGYDPGRLQVFPVALVRRGKEWAAAPLPASFENAGAGHAIALRKRLEQLENWMLREQVIDLEKLREQSNARMRRKIHTSLPLGELRALTAKQAGLRFLSACQNRDLPALLGLLGGLATKLPEDWPLRLRAAEFALKPGTNVPEPWRRLIASEVLQVVVHQESEENGGLVSIACLDPSRPPRPSINLVHLVIAKDTEGHWRIDPPDSFLQGAEAVQESSDDDLDSDLIDAFPAEWRKIHPVTPQPDAAMAHQTLIAALRSANPAALLRLTHFGADPSAAREACISAARLWWTLHDPTAVRHTLPLALQENADTAAGILQIFSARDPDRLNLETLYFKKSDKGWLWHPAPDAAILDTFKDLPELDAGHWSGEWQKLLLAESFEIQDLQHAQAPTQADAQKVVAAWLEATRCGDLKAALALTARLRDPKGHAPLLRNLGHEVMAARKTGSAPLIIGTYPGKRLTAVGFKIDLSGTASHPLYPVIQTPAGARILIEIDLFASRGREFLNKLALTRLENLALPAAAVDLRTLLAQFQSSVDALKSPEN